MKPSSFEAGWYRFTVLAENKTMRVDPVLKTTRFHIKNKKQAELFLEGFVSGVLGMLGTGWQWKEYSWKKWE
mgnify:CR=1 FL=1